jgi:hypothetical protein
MGDNLLRDPGVINKALTLRLCRLDRRKRALQIFHDELIVGRLHMERICFTSDKLFTVLLLHDIFPIAEELCHPAVIHGGKVERREDGGRLGFLLCDFETKLGETGSEEGMASFVCCDELPDEVGVVG